MLTSPTNTREKLMRAALEIVARDGFPAATTAAIAEGTGVAEGTLYRHFPSKEDLLVETYRQLKRDVFAAIIAETGTATQVRARFAALWRGMWTAYSGDLVAFAFGQRFGESSLSKKEGGAAHEAFFEHVGALITDGQADGEIKPLPPEMLKAFFFPPLIAMLKQLSEGRAWTEAEIDAAIDAAWDSWRV